MHETEQLSALIGNVYDAALDKALWPNVLGMVRAFVGGWAASLAWKDAVSKHGNDYYNDGVQDPYYQKLYFDKYIKMDPTTSIEFFGKIDEPQSISDLMPYAEYIETRVFREWCRPQGIVDAVWSLLDVSATSAAAFVVFRRERVDDETLRRARLIVPHIRRAALIGKVIDLKTAEAASLADTLDGISAGMFLVDATGRIVHANHPGHAMLNRADVLRATSGRLAAVDRKVDQTLADIFATVGDGDVAIGIKGVAIPITARDGERYVAHVLPLASGARSKTAKSYAAVAALFVQKAVLNIVTPPRAIAEAYGLTPMELRVLLAIVEVGGVPEVAEALGVAETTVKTHLGRLYQKTGAGRQADLVKLVAGFSNPLQG